MTSPIADPAQRASANGGSISDPAVPGWSTAACTTTPIPASHQGIPAGIMNNSASIRLAASSPAISAMYSP